VARVLSNVLDAKHFQTCKELFEFLGVRLGSSDSGAHCPDLLIRNHECRTLSPSESRWLRQNGTQARSNLLASPRRFGKWDLNPVSGI
jgi:hypothetical protein